MATDGPDATFAGSQGKGSTDLEGTSTVVASGTVTALRKVQHTVQTLGVSVGGGVAARVSLATVKPTGATDAVTQTARFRDARGFAGGTFGIDATLAFATWGTAVP